jgi:hypothetical protein
LTGIKNWENLQSNDLIPELRTITHFAEEIKSHPDKRKAHDLDGQ